MSDQLQRRAFLGTVSALAAGAMLPAAAASEAATLTEQDVWIEVETPPKKRQVLVSHRTHEHCDRWGTWHFTTMAAAAAFAGKGETIYVAEDHAELYGKPIG